MIKNITINDFPPFKKGITFELATINLFTGKNGSGKSRFLKEFHRCVVAGKDSDTSKITIQSNSQNHFSQYIKEERFSEVRDIGLAIPTTTNLEGVNPREFFSNYTLPNELLKNFNLEFSSHINRELIISREEGKGEYAEYKKNGIRIRPNDDGFGLLNLIYLYQFPLQAKENSIIIIEEPTIGLYPALSEPFLTILAESVIGKNKQLICTSHDVFTMLHFINKIREFPEYKLFRFSEDDNNEINIQSYDSKKINDFVTDFFGDFPTPNQLKSLQMLLKTIECR